MTPPLTLLQALAGAVLAGCARAQEDSSSNQVTSTSSKVWAAVAFINHGETNPFLLNEHPILTPNGAQQLYRQGEAFRGRYLDPSSVANTSDAAAPIQGLTQNAIDNTQLRILSQTDSWVVGGAVAFMQALYPANSKAFNAAAGGKVLAENHIGSNTTSYPLDGYQYPQIETLPSTDASSIAIQGHVGCPVWDNTTANLTNNPDLKDAAQKNADFYTTLFNSGPLEGTLPADDANFFNAYDIYNLVKYEFTHNETVFANLTDPDAKLAQLAENAYTMERARSDPGASTANDTASVALTIAGRAFAKHVVDQMSFNANQTKDESRRLTLMFGSFQPLMAFFSVADLLTHSNVVSTPIGNVTAPGAAIVFELIGEESDDVSRFPKPEDLRVRFVYRPTAEATDSFQVFSLFGSGDGGRSIPYLAFRDKMTAIGRDAVDWCKICKPGSARAWCQEVPSSGGSNGKGKGGGGKDGDEGSSQMKPAVAGVIGAVIMGALIGLAFLALCGLGGFRLQRRNRQGAGFRGPEKPPGDQDVQYGSGGDAQERIGSWEMRGQPEGQGQQLRVQQQRNPFEDDTGSDVGGAAPVKTRDGF